MLSGTDDALGSAPRFSAGSTCAEMGSLARTNVEAGGSAVTRIVDRSTLRTNSEPEKVRTIFVPVRQLRCLDYLTCGSVPSRCSWNRALERISCSPVGFVALGTGGRTRLPRQAGARHGVQDTQRARGKAAQGPLLPGTPRSRIQSQDGGGRPHEVLQSLSNSIKPSDMIRTLEMLY
jgi:hypothetical protein